MSEGHGGISDTGRCHVCATEGHLRERKRRQVLRAPVEHSRLVGRVYDALANSKAERQSDRDRWVVRYAGNCKAPIAIKSHASTGVLFVTTLTRCRKCRPCRLARMGYWARAAMEHTETTAEENRRSWFGTLTLSAEWQQRFLEEARFRWANRVARSSAIPDWWDDPTCDERFAEVRAVLVEEVQKYWKRLRKKGHAFKYLLVFERHKSGLPHMHFMLHETDAKILARQLREEWPYGFTKMKLVKGPDVRRAAWYVTKYLSKSVQARQIASLGYAKTSKTTASSPNAVA